MSRRHISAKERTRVFMSNRGICHICGLKIDGGHEAWDVEHVIPLSMGGDDFGDNLQPAHVKCHKAKTRADAGHNAKGNRMEQRGIGVKRQSRHPLPGGKSSRWKRKINGEVVRRG